MIYATHTDKKEAEKIVSGLLEERLIACANLYPISSMYTWKGKVNKEAEIVTILKTKQNNWNKIKEYIKKHHSYEVPCIINMGEMEPNEEFMKWVKDETK